MDATPFTPIASTLGGLLIGLSTAVLLLGAGRIAGISGIAGGCLGTSRDELPWRLSFLFGLPVGGGLVALAQGGIDMHVAASPALLVVAGLLVGFGTQLGNGCTSGHGVCGVSRGSTRSLAATAVFMAVAAVTVFVVRHVLGAGR